MFLPLQAEPRRVGVPWVTLALVVANLAVFGWELRLGPSELLTFARGAGMVPWEISHLQDLVSATQPRDLVPPPLTILSSMFIHGDLMHVAGNAWFLWLFGSRLERLVGASRFLLLYLVAGVMAALLQVWVLPSSTVPMIGASGAIAGVLGGYAILLPRAEVRCLVFLLVFVTFARLPARIVLALWFLAQFVASPARSSGVAWCAHTGGFVAGALLGAALMRPLARRRLDQRAAIRAFDSALPSRA